MSLFDDAASGRSTVPPPRFRWGTRVLLPVALILATSALLIGAAWRSFFPGVPVEVVPVMVKTIEGTVGSASVTATGWLEPDPYPTYASALASGTVEAVLVLEGQAVSAGDPVARLVSDDARLALEAADADRSMAEAAVARAEASLAAERERLETRIELRRNAASTEARLAAAEAALAAHGPAMSVVRSELAALSDEIERKRPLVASGAVTAGAFRRLELAHEAKRSEVAAVDAQRPVLVAERDRARAEREAAAEALERTIDERLGVAVAEARLAEARAASARAEARRADAALHLERTTVRAPIAGIVMRRLVSPGSRIQIEGEAHAGHVVHLYDPAHLQVRVDVPLADAGAVGAEQAAEVSVSVLPDRVFRGRVTRMVHEADLQKNTVEVKVAVEDPSPLLKPEMLARVRFLASGGRTESRQRLLVPERLLEEANGGTAVWIVTERIDDRGVATRRSVTAGPTVVDGWREVTSGLQPGDWLISEPPGDLSPGDAVTITGEANR